jgi:hypothetical protein
MKNQKRYRLHKNPMHGFGEKSERVDAFHMQDGHILTVLVRERAEIAWGWTVLAWQDSRRGDGVPIAGPTRRRIDARRMAERWMRERVAIRALYQKSIDELAKQGLDATPVEFFGGYIDQ